MEKSNVTAWNRNRKLEDQPYNMEQKRNKDNCSIAAVGFDCHYDCEIEI